MDEIKKRSDGHPQGCLVGKYKPFGKQIKFLAWIKTLNCPFLQKHFYTKNKKNKN